jgi:serine/threonine-protein kinase RsbW
MNEDVTVTAPAATTSLVVLRTTVRSFAATDAFTLDQLDDLRMAVDEAATRLAAHTSGETLTMRVSATATGMRVLLSAQATHDSELIGEGSFSYSVLIALADDLSVSLDEATASVELVKHHRGDTG